jgi:catechol 2,3-dioxygenase-like lactoylglutathione lyase family enzyme
MAGIHHVTAIADGASKTVAFRHRDLGLRFGEDGEVRRAVERSPLLR